MEKVALILAGGLGSKFWPKSTENTPKQFKYLYGEGTLLQNTYNRLLPFFKRENIFIVLSYAYKDLALEQIPSLQEENLIFEPFGRGTAPCTALSVNYILNKGFDENTLLSVFPADHIISNLGEFYHSLELSFEFASRNQSIVTIGIEPSRPETQFGYIQIDTSEKQDSGIYYCLTFAEKPDANTAQRFIDTGDFLWNSGIFICSINVFRNSFKKFLPDYNLKLSELNNIYGTKEYIEELRLIYKQISSISLDHGILEKADNVFCVNATFSWSDLSNWDELYRVQMKDANQNILMGDVVSINNKNSFIMSKDKLIGVVGMEDIIVIDTKEAIMICKRGQSDQVQEIVDFLRRKHIHKYL